MERRSIGWHNVGILLAIFSGLLLLSAAIWPHVALRTPAPRAAWAISLVVGLGFLASAFVAERSTLLSKAILALGAAVLLVSGLVGGQLFGSDQGIWLTLTALAPIVLGIIAAVLIGPIQREQTP